MNTLILFGNDGIYEKKRKEKSFKIGECIKNMRVQRM